MVRPIMIVAGAIPAIFALLFAISLLSITEIPTTAVSPNDVIEFEYTKHQLKKISFGVTEQTEAQKTEILIITNDGSVRYTVTENGIPQPDKNFHIDEAAIKKLTALIKETGFISIPSESFPVRDEIDEYQKSILKITLNGQVNKINWPEQNATEKFVPPIITLVQSELDNIINQIE